jgi:hypothetical protein
MSTPSNDICIVGYALNKKKLRKSGTAAVQPSSLSPNTREQNVQQQKEPHTDSSFSSVWKGGGLADLLNDKMDTSVRFVPVDFEKPLEQQPAFHVILHKLTEDIRSQDVAGDSKAKLRFLSEYLR